jgi:hypothetical protein
MLSSSPIQAVFDTIFPSGVPGAIVTGNMMVTGVPLCTQPFHSMQLAVSVMSWPEELTQTDPGMYTAEVGIASETCTVPQSP